MAKLPKKKCPKAGVLVTTKAGLVGATTGNCGKRRSVEVALLGVGSAEFRRGELRTLTAKQTERVKAELKRVPKLGPTQRGRRPEPQVAPAPMYNPYGPVY